MFAKLIEFYDHKKDPIKIFLSFTMKKIFLETEKKKF